MNDLLWMALGLGGLVGGSELLVRAAGSIARRFAVPTLIVGLTITSIGTSVPEIATNMMVGVNAVRGLGDASGVAVGNILGSCLTQVTLLLGIAGLAQGLGAPRGRREPMALVGAIIATALVGFDGIVLRAEGVALVLAYFLYVAVIYNAASGAPPEESPPPDRHLSLDIALVVIGLVVLTLSASMLVESAVDIARVFGLSETTVGVFVGMGTGLPELAVAISALRQRDEGIAIGNLLGSNITDPLLSFGLGAMVHPVLVPVGDLVMDFLFWVAGTLIALLLLHTGRRLDRHESAVLLVVFALYVAMRINVA